MVRPERVATAPGINLENANGIAAADRDRARAGAVDHHRPRWTGQAPACWSE